jgi:hypothetical protein
MPYDCVQHCRPYLSAQPRKTECEVKIRGHQATLMGAEVLALQVVAGSATAFPHTNQTYDTLSNLSHEADARRSAIDLRSTAGREPPHP